MNKRLIIICGTWNENFSENYKSLIEHCGVSLCDVIIVSDKMHDELDRSSCIVVENDCIDEKVFSYKCLEYGNYEKNKIELENFKLYEVCFFVDSNDMEGIKFGKEFVYPSMKQIVTSDITELSKEFRGYSATKIKTISTSFWYSKSIDFNIISQFWKGEHYNLRKNYKRKNFTIYNFREYPYYDLTFSIFLSKLHFSFVNII